MKVRGSIEILKGVFLPNPGGLSPRKGLFAMSDQAGNVQWKDLIIPPVVTGMQYPDSGTVVHNGISVYMSLVEDALGSDLLEKTIWLELGSTGEGEKELTDEQLAAINAAHAPTASNPFATLNDVQNLTVVGSAPIEDILQGSFLYKNVIWIADTAGFDSFGNPVVPGDGITSTSTGWLNFGPFRGPGVIPGGLAGQVLQKASGTDYDTRWVDYAGSHGLQKVVDISKTADKIELIHRNAPEGVFQEAVTSGYPDFYIAWILQTTGGYYVYGNFESYNNNGGKGLLKFFNNGIEDPSFNVGSGLNSYPYSGAEMMEHGGKLYISGNFTEYNAVPANRIVCLNSDGSINTSFVTTGFNDFTLGLAASSDGRIYVCGAFSTYNGISVPRFVKLTLTGDIDTSFIMGTGFNNVTIDVIYIPSTSNLVVLGYFSQYNGETTGNIVMLNVSGARVPSFVSGTGFNTGNFEPNKGVLTPDNKLVIAGYFTEYNGIQANYIIRLNLDGSVDTTFAIGSGFDDIVYDVKVLESGRYLVTGDFTTYQGVACSGNIILNTDGSIYQIISVPGTLFNIHDDVLLCADDVTLTIKELYGYRLISGSSFTFDEFSGKAEYNIGGLPEVTSEEIMPRRLIEELIVDMAGTGHADHLNVVPHDDYLTGTTVQEQLDQTEENIVKSYGLHKANYRNLYQTGIFKVDYDVSVLTVTTDTLLITACNNILFINEININVNSNKLEDYLLSFGDVSFVANATNTPLSEDTTGIYYVGVDKLGSAVYRDSKVYDQDICYMARLVIDNIAGIYSIESVKYIPDLAENKLNDRDRKVGVSGFMVPSTLPHISFCNRSVTYYKNSVNYSNSKYDPNYLVVPDTVDPFAMSFLFMVPGLPSATIVPVTTINPKAWYLPNGDLGGINVADSSYQVYRFLVNVTGTLLIQTKASSDQSPQPGVNAIYANREDAIAWLSTIIFEDIFPIGDAVEIGRFYLKAGTPVDGSLLNDIDDFCFFPTVVSSSSSSVGVTEHDNLSGKNDNPAFLHVTEADLISLNDAVHKTPDEVIIGKKTFNPLISSGAIEINIQNHTTNYSDAIVANLNGGSLAGTGFIGGLTIHTTGNKNYGVYFSPSGSGIENSAIHYRRKAGTSGNFVVTLEDEPLGSRTFSIADTGIINAMSFVKIGGIPSQFLKADGSVDANVYALASALHTPVTIAPISNGLAIEEATQVLSIEVADADTTGVISGEDWSRFNDNLDKNFIFEQLTSATEWYITHNLNKYPSVASFDSSGTEIKGSVTYDSLNSLIIKFNIPIIGTATLN